MQNYIRIIDKNELHAKIRDMLKMKLGLGELGNYKFQEYNFTICGNKTT